MSTAGKFLLVGALCIISVITAAILSNNKQSQTSDSASCESSPKTLRFSMSSNNKHPIFSGASKFKELVEQSTDITVNIFPSAQLGDDRASIEMLQLGTLDIAIPSTGPLANFSSAFNVFDLPFMFQSEAVADDVLRSNFAGTMLNILKDKQLIGLDFWENGFRHLTNSTRAVNTIDDVSGLKIRTMESALHLDAWQALGATPTPMAFKELFTALQQGTVDGQENPYPNIALNNLYEVQEYLTDTGHVYTPLVLLFSAKTWSTLSVSEQVALREAAKEAGDYQRKVNREMNKQSLAQLNDHMTITTLPLAERKKFQQATLPVLEKYKDVIGENIVTQFQQAIKTAEMNDL
ncbi:TRAP transporter substrate-binding protein [Pseudocolwellia agarivorans]|uniref:TRAP transporter substrate-binding protein n=1 Tax=Pseudocolwellia agarivorans TaxID=1911682 RepID=UPI0009869497|nr:TRAP transporter substrate-binding protein [Pseudocolwellia agarivorans]